MSCRAPLVLVLCVWGAWSGAGCADGYEARESQVDDPYTMDASDRLLALQRAMDGGSPRVALSQDDACSLRVEARPGLRRASAGAGYDLADLMPEVLPSTQGSAWRDLRLSLRERAQPVLQVRDLDWMDAMRAQLLVQLLRRDCLAERRGDPS